MNILSLGIQIAQAQISIDNARSLGLISYLTFLKVKAENKYLQSKSAGSKGDSSLHSDLKFKFISLRNSVNRLLKVLKNDLKESRSIDSFVAIDNAMKSNNFLTNDKLWEINDLLNATYLSAQDFIDEPGNNFSSRIQTLQSMAAIKTCDHLLTMDSIAPHGNISILVDSLSQLRIRSFNVEVELELEMAG